MTRRPAPEPGPLLRAIPFITDALKGTEAMGKTRLLTDRQRQDLASIATRLVLPRRTIVYRQQTPAGFVYICAEGAVKSFRDLPSGRRRILAFMFRGDLFGLSENGRYVNTTQTTVPTTCYRLPLTPLVAMLLNDPKLEFAFLCKVTHELRESQHRAIIVGRRSAKARIAMLLAMLEECPLTPETPGTIPIPMSRVDMADYLGLTAESISRATRELEKAGIVAFDKLHSARILDRRQFARLADES